MPTIELYPTGVLDSLDVSFCGPGESPFGSNLGTSRAARECVLQRTNDHVNVPFQLPQPQSFQNHRIMDEEESKRVSVQVSSLSTRLIESIEHQGHLEQQIAQLRESNELLSKKADTETATRERAELEVSNLQKEVEELSASLFAEANKMVSDARREKHEIQLRNDSLVSQLKEKDQLIDNLQQELTILKDVLHEKDRDLDAGSAQDAISAKPVLYSPTVDAIRYDLKLFGEFKRFARTVKNIESIREHKLVKRLVADDIEPALRLESAQGISWLNRRSMMAHFIDGHVSIEPVSGINETHRVNTNLSRAPEAEAQSGLYSYPSQSPPVAVNQPCALCGEERDDILEHSRLYLLKVHPKAESSLSPATPVPYPLCSYCLFRVRSACDLFAFLRSLQTDVWKLTDGAVQKKAWIELSRLRAKLLWSKVGIWDVDANIITTKITPSTEDSVYASVTSKTYSAARSPKLEGHKSLPLANELKGPVEFAPQDLDLREIKEADEVVDTPEESAQEEVDPIVGEVVESAESEPATKYEPEEEEPYDILDTYSEDQSDTDLPNTKTKGLEIHVETELRPQDDLVYSEQSTPIGKQGSTFPTPTDTNSEPATKSDKDFSDEDQFVDA